MPMIEDPEQADWMKFKQLKEIQTLRNIKKDLIISQAMTGPDMGNNEKVFMSRGHASFLKYPLQNAYQTNQVYIITIDDPDQDYFMDKPEAQLVYSSTEVEHWASLGKATTYPSYDLVTETDTVVLKPG